MVVMAIKGPLQQQQQLVLMLGLADLPLGGGWGPVEALRRSLLPLLDHQGKRHAHAPTPMPDGQQACDVARKMVSWSTSAIHDSYYHWMRRGDQPPTWAVKSAMVTGLLSFLDIA